MRTEKFRPVLLAHQHAQHGEGLCIPALLGAHLRSAGKKDWQTEWVAKELGTTTEEGTPDQNILLFVKSMSVRHYDEANCSPGRLKTLLTGLPDEVSLMIGIWDDRPPRPGYTVETDKPEQHNLGLLRAVNNHIEVYDPDTIIGGPKRIDIKTLFEVWHDGPGSVWGLPPVCGTHIAQDSVAWVLVLGADRAMIHRLVGPADHEANPYQFDKRVTVPKDGRLRVDPAGLEPAT